MSIIKTASLPQLAVVVIMLLHITLAFVIKELEVLYNKRIRQDADCHFII
jgi:hypothetical protein